MLYLAAIAILGVMCRVGGVQKYAWLTAIPFSVGIAMNVLLMTERMPRLNGTNIVEFPEVLICMAASVLSEEAKLELACAGVSAETVWEDDVANISLTLPEVGEYL